MPGCTRLTKNKVHIDGMYTKAGSPLVLTGLYGRYAFINNDNPVSNNNNHLTRESNLRAITIHPEIKCKCYIKHYLKNVP